MALLQGNYLGHTCWARRNNEVAVQVMRKAIPLIFFALKNDCHSSGLCSVVVEMKTELGQCSVLILSHYMFFLELCTVAVMKQICNAGKYECMDETLEIEDRSFPRF